MKKSYAFSLLTAILAMFSFMIAGKTSAQSKVVIAGTFQSELGCNLDWEPNCDFTALTKLSDSLWAGSFLIPAGCHRYKVTIDGTWDINYGENGGLFGADISLYLPQETLITFTFNLMSQQITTSPIASGFSPQCLPMVVLAGTFQTEVGCATDWDGACTNTALAFNPGTGLFEGDLFMPKGCFEYKVVLDNNWVNNFGQGGQVNGSSYRLSIPDNSTAVHFTYDPISHIVQSPYNTNFCLPDKVVLAGTFQSELGCPGDWMADCNNSELIYNPQSGLFEGDLMIPNGCYEYRAVLNGDWATNYGQYGSPDGPNYILSLPGKDDLVHFTFDPVYNIVSSPYNSWFCQPSTVVIAGSFQDELGCAGDWLADCDNTRLNFDAATGNWVDTFNIPAGKWDYKVTLNNSWDENYGLYGVPNGDKIPFEICYPAQVIFTYNPQYHYAYTQVITTGICLSKFYDPNVNNYQEEGELPMAGVSFTLTGNGITQVQTTDNNGKAAFTGLPEGGYWIKETIPQGYLTSGQDSQFVYLYGLTNVYFGNVCLGPATGGAKGKGFWTSKNGEAALNNAGKMEYALFELRYLNLRNDDGSDFDPFTYEQLRTWLKGANAKNMAYMVSAQLATLYFNQSMGYVDPYNNFIYIGTCSQLLYSKFMSIDALIWNTNSYLWYTDSTTGKDLYRTLLECLKNTLENANNNLNYVQPEPCDKGTITSVKQAVKIPAENLKGETKLWPNPSNNYFTIRPGYNTVNETMNLNVFDANGKKVYQTRGSANKDYRFGNAFTPGMYFVEAIQGNRRSTFKVIKQ